MQTEVTCQSRVQINTFSESVISDLKQTQFRESGRSVTLRTLDFWPLNITGNAIPSCSSLPLPPDPHPNRDTNRTSSTRAVLSHFLFLLFPISLPGTSGRADQLWIQNLQITDRIREGGDENRPNFWNLKVVERWVMRGQRSAPFNPSSSFWCPIPILSPFHSVS